MLSLLLAQIVTAGTTFPCTPTRVWDGDGPIWCAEGPRIRLGGIAAREMDGSCRRGHPCPRASGPVARDALVRLLGGAHGTTPTGHVVVRGPTLQCRSEGHAKGERTAAWCVAPRVGNLSCAMLRTNTVAIWPRYSQGRICRR
ncbi:hypothetical protein KRZ98_17645 [Sphingobium sp. AS12]|uniref:thermonuclease family protein n=1 Tax=Sphingobium sp. AS12 TaxID=2849495 RepID=UPI001C315245|nr:hypothetical protein [Sphingobium sp. AS12]MBV2150070.1 hypothetical protein [Sphingobium sp. AS12]